MPFYLFCGMAAAGVMITTHFIVGHGMLRLKSSIVRCDATEESLYFTQKNGKRVKGIPLSSSIITPSLLLLAWKPVNHPVLPTPLSWLQPLIPSNLFILTTDNISSFEDFRRLRVLLKFGKLNTSKPTTESSSQ